MLNLLQKFGIPNSLKKSHSILNSINFQLTHVSLQSTCISLNLQLTQFSTRSCLITVNFENLSELRLKKNLKKELRKYWELSEVKIEWDFFKWVRGCHKFIVQYSGKIDFRSIWFLLMLSEHWIWRFSLRIWY